MEADLRWWADSGGSMELGRGQEVARVLGFGLRPPNSPKFVHLERVRNEI
jgi:hypothetical protein